MDLKFFKKSKATILFLVEFDDLYNSDPWEI